MATTITYINTCESTSFVFQGKEVACNISRLPPGSVVFEDIGTQVFKGQVLKPLERANPARHTNDPLPGRIRYRAVDHSEVEVPFGDKDQVCFWIYAKKIHCSLTLTHNVHNILFKTLAERRLHSSSWRLGAIFVGNGSPWSTTTSHIDFIVGRNVRVVGWTPWRRNGCIAQRWLWFFALRRSERSFVLSFHWSPWYGMFSLLPK